MGRVQADLVPFAKPQLRSALAAYSALMALVAIVCLVGASAFGANPQPGGGNSMTAPARVVD